MSKGEMSILGLYRNDNTIFDGFLLPVGMDKTTVVDNLMLELCELEILYPDANVMKLAIETWSKKEIEVWKKLYATEHFDYNPLWNLNRTEEYHNLETRDLHAESESTRDLNVHSANTGGDTVTEYVNAYNDGTGTESGKNVSQLGGISNVDDTGTVANSADDTGTVKHDNTATMQGSIGIITSQTMIEQERGVDKFNTLDYIINSFKNRFCILVY